MVETRNILIIGKTGGGKSALANVLSDSDEFKEDDSSLTKSWRAVDREFEIEDKKVKEKKIRYRVVDTVGLGNAKLSKEELLTKFEEEIGNYIDEGISQIFFVMDERDGKLGEEKALDEFLWINESLFDGKALDYTTIIRTKFSHFRSKEEREKNTRKLISFFNNNKEEYKEINVKVLERKKIVYLNNEEKSLRKKSRNKLLVFLDNFSNENFYQSESKEWFDKNFPENERKAKIVLDISKKNLKGRLSPKGFKDLKRLSCSDNKLTILDLSDCKNLIELNCADNKLTNLNFLRHVTNLEQLNVSSCPLKGSLQPLKDLTKLKVLFITNTNFNKGLEYLPTGCKKLVCDSDLLYESSKIMKELDENKCFEKDPYNKKYYNLDIWRETDKQNKLTTDVIPLERFFVIRNNIKKFIDRWGKKEITEADNPHWYTKYLDYAQVPFNKLSELLIKQEQGNSTELSKLKSPAQYEKNWYWTVPQWGGRGLVGISGILGISGSLSFEDHKIGAIAVASPIIETITSYAKKNWYEDKEKQWEEFTQDTKELLDNYHELLGILKTIRSSELGQLNKVLRKLKKTTEEFLNEYDSDNNGIISVLELKESKNKEKLADDLNNENKWAGGSKLGRIIKLMKMLEEKINAYVQKKPFKEKSFNDKKQGLAWIVIDALTEYSDSEFNAKDAYNSKGKERKCWNKKNSWESYLKDVINKKEDFERQKQNLLYPLVETMTERLNKFNVEELFANHKENEKLLNEFAKKIQIICKIKKKLRNEELNVILSSLENKIKELLSHLEKKPNNVIKNETAIAIEEKERNLDEIIKVIKNLEERVKTCHETLAAQVEQSILKD